MSNNKTQRFFCKDILGRDLFYLDLIFIEEYELILLETSLHFDVSALPQGQPYISQICEAHYNPERRMGLIALLFIFIKALPGIEEYYFKDFVLDKYGHFVEYSYKTILDIILQEKLPEFTLFSSKDNYIYFYGIVNFLKKEIQVNPLKISRQQFEYLITDHLPLQLEYFESSAPHSEFFMVKCGRFTPVYRYFIMANNFSIKMFFFVIGR